MFILSPVDFFISLVENLLLGLTPENFLKFNTFPEGVLEVLHVTIRHITEGMLRRVAMGC